MFVRLGHIVYEALAIYETCGRIYIPEGMRGTKAAVKRIANATRLKAFVSGYYDALLYCD